MSRPLQVSQSRWQAWSFIALTWVQETRNQVSIAARSAERCYKKIQRHRKWKWRLRLRRVNFNPCRSHFLGTGFCEHFIHVFSCHLSFSFLCFSWLHGHLDKFCAQKRSLHITANFADGDQVNGFTAVWFLQAQGAQMQDLVTTVRQLTASSRVQPQTPQHQSLPSPVARAQAATTAITQVRDSSLRCNCYVISKCKITSLVTVTVFNKWQNFDFCQVNSTSLYGIDSYT